MGAVEEAVIRRAGSYPDIPERLVGHRALAVLLDCLYSQNASTAMQELDRLALETEGAMVRYYDSGTAERLRARAHYRAYAAQVLLDLCDEVDAC